MIGLVEGMSSSPEVRVALAVGTIVAVITAAVGVLTVLRGQSFAAHALTDLASVGGSAAFLFGGDQLWGFVIASVLSALGMHAIGIERIRKRDIATGIVLSAGMGLTALFLMLAATGRSSGGSPMSVLFGSLFSLRASVVPLVCVLAILCAVVLALIWRPSLLATASLPFARARGARTRAVDALFMCALGIGVALGAISVGAVLATALLVGPAASSLRVAGSTRAALVASCLIGVACVWGGVALSYASYAFLGGRSLSASFCIVALVFVCYLAALMMSGIEGAARKGARKRV
ncbi:ABC-3 protein [Coriobacterium glomerans PW2]|uniref:ABC-3 protein n=1 Tax=Coriobacterium glomerans (strain ATCC 49209 / DSM 20642 / JCM 10262 / PW2) TaxID=700015 RepID=F2NAU2_CORGP|nr:metal ABC transporter permease [Coriobacterium glomerans]AEB07620.1 ABC-3 protein [Coriobacterium glomerans PW2]